MGASRKEKATPGRGAEGAWERQRCGMAVGPLQLGAEEAGLTGTEGRSGGQGR